jgi:hypothetical protein
MDTLQSKVIGTGIFFLFIFLSGFWLARYGKPHNVILLTIHKLISLAVIVFLGMTIYQVNQVTTLSKTELTTSIVTGLSFVVTIITGGLVSMETTMPAAITIVHKLAPYLTVLSTVATLYLLLS